MTETQHYYFLMNEHSIDTLEDTVFSLLENISKECKFARLILEEWLVNIISYGGKDPIEVWVSFPSETSVMISDTGTPFDITTYPQKDIDMWTIGGKGLFLIRELSKSLHYEYKDEKNYLTIQF